MPRLQYNEIKDIITNHFGFMHEAEKVLTNDQVTDYITYLRGFCPDENWHGTWGVHATAAQWAEAFLRTIGKWEED